LVEKQTGVVLFTLKESRFGPVKFFKKVTIGKENLNRFMVCEHCYQTKYQFDEFLDVFLGEEVMGNDKSG
jgi:hypothetical protein